MNSKGHLRWALTAKVGALGVLIVLLGVLAVPGPAAAQPSSIAASSSVVVSSPAVVSVWGCNEGDPLAWTPTCWGANGIGSFFDATSTLGKWLDFDGPTEMLFEVITQGIFYPAVQGAEILITSAFVGDFSRIDSSQWSVAATMTGRIGGIMTLVTLVLCGLQITWGALSRSGARVSRGIAGAVLAWPAVGVAVWMIMGLNAAADSLVGAVLEDVDLSVIIGGLLAPVTMPTSLTGSTNMLGMVFLWAILALLIFLPALLLHLTFIFRNFGLLLMAGFSPAAIMVLGFEKAKNVFSRWLGLVAALLLAKPVAALLLAFGAELIESATVTSLDTILIGLVSLWVAVASPVMVGKLFGWLGVEAASTFSTIGSQAGKQMIQGATAPIKVTAQLALTAATMGAGAGMLSKVGTLLNGAKGSEDAVGGTGTKNMVAPTLGDGGGTNKPGDGSADGTKPSVDGQRTSESAGQTDPSVPTVSQTPPSSVAGGTVLGGGQPSEESSGGSAPQQAVGVFAGNPGQLEGAQNMFPPPVQGPQGSQGAVGGIGATGEGGRGGDGGAGTTGPSGAQGTAGAEPDEGGPFGLNNANKG